MSLDRRTFLIAGSAAVAGSSWVSAADASNSWTYFGCYTGGKGGSKGITCSSFDAKSGALSEPFVAAEVGSPSFLAIHPNNKFLYAVGEGAVKGNTGGGIYSFAIDGKTGMLKKLNAVDSVGKGPCMISVDPSGRMIFVANYGGGSSVAYALLEDGSIGVKLGFWQYKGTSANKQRQESPHTHSTAFTTNGKYCLVVDLGIDQVMVYRTDAMTGTISDRPESIKLPPGTGPRHIAINKDMTIAYINGELNMTANVIKLDLENQKYSVVQSLSTVPEGKPMPGYSTAEVKIHPNGKFVYVSNRGQNSIAAFAIQKDGTLKKAGYITGDIKTPRNFNIDPSGKWMLIANQDGHTVQVYEMDEKTGLAKSTDAVVKVGSPVCVKFVPKA